MSLVPNRAIEGAAGNQGYNLQRSLRFRSSASAYLNRTPASAGNRQTWTWSAWVKRSIFGSTQRLFTAADALGNDAAIRFDGDNFRFYNTTQASGGFIFDVKSSAVYRDPSAWYHIVGVLDTTNATAANRVRLYVNGTQITALATASYPTQNINGTINTGSFAHYHGIYPVSLADEKFDGYLAEVNFIDGQALTPSSFGQTDAVTGVWTPKKYTGTYGTNGFYLDFKDNTSATTLAYDKSGNGNNWTPNNISTTAGNTYDSMLDVPTLTSATAANYCVLNPLNKPSAFTLSNGNLNLSSTVDNNNCVGTFGVTSGKWYFEFVPTNMSSGASVVGIAKDPINTATYIGGSANSWGYHPNGMKYNNASGSAYGASYTDNDVIGVALDVDSGSLTFYKNGTSQGVAFSGLTAGTYFANVQSNNLGASYANFGQRSFSYTPPTGFKALNTFNLPDPTIKKPNQYMDVYTNTGSGTTRTDVIAFQPDLVWTKTRNTATNGFNIVQDSVRGAGYRLITDGTYAESYDATYGSFTSTGFQFGSNLNVNTNGNTYVDWFWKKGATPGFDIVTYTGTGSNRTISHNLGIAPSMMIVKIRSGISDNWFVYHKSLGATQKIQLNLTNAADANSSYWNDTAPTSSVFSLGTNAGVNGNTYTYVNYLFAEIAGFSKFGSYTGNGSADGPFVYCGFRPKYVMWKNASAVADWLVFDSSRSQYNAAAQRLYPSASYAEDTGNDCDLLSNGFKLRNTGSNVNGSGNTIIYAAFAENPTKYSLAR